MNPLKTVLFPATVIHSIRQYPLFLLFSKIHIISPVESKKRNLPEESTDTFINSGLCQVDTPCPLGENLDRFLHLLGDIKNRKDDYAAQLSSLTLAAMSLPKSSGEESERSIIKKFLTPRVSATEKQRNREAKLWQARLVLAIGELLDLQEEEIAKSLCMAEDETSDLFSALHGDTKEFEDSPFAEQSWLTINFSAVYVGNTKKRFNSWAQLFAESKHTDADIFIASSTDVLDIITELYEKISEHDPSTCPGLELPGLIGWTEEEAVAAVKSFRQENSQGVAELESILRAFSNNEKQSEKTWNDFIDAWNSRLEIHFPAAVWGRRKVSVNVFKACSLSSLVGVKSDTKTTTNTIVLVVE